LGDDDPGRGWCHRRRQIQDPAGIGLSGTGLITITLPPWLMAGCYALIGWAIGLRFTREIVLYAARGAGGADPGEGGGEVDRKLTRGR
jgi:hypothetical protein